MSHARQHSGFATQAVRRGERLVVCNTCGHRHARNTYPVDVPDERVTPLKFLGMVGVMLLMWGAAFYALPIIFAAVQP
jgi:hypothetical protein